MKQNLEEDWGLSSNELDFINNRQVEYRLAFAIKFKFYQKNGYSLDDLKDVDRAIILHISSQIEQDISTSINYRWNSRTAREHNLVIRKHFNFRIMDTESLEELKTWVFLNHLPLSPLYNQLKELVYKHLYELKIEPYSVIMIERYLNSWIRKFENDFFVFWYNKLGIDSKKSLDKLIEEGLPKNVVVDSSDVGKTSLDEDATISTDNIVDKNNVWNINNSIDEDIDVYLNDLRQDPGKASLESMKIETTKLKRIRNTGIDNLKDFDKARPKLIKKYHDQVTSTPPGQLRDYADSKKYTMLICFCHLKKMKIIDNLIEIFLQLIHRVNVRAKSKIKQEMWNNRRLIYNKELILTNIVSVSLEHPKGIIEEEIYPKVGKEILEDIIKKPKNYNEYYQERKYYYMRSSYIKHYRRMLSEIFDNLNFSSNDDSKSLLEAIELIKKYQNSNVTYYPDEEIVPLDKVIPKSQLDLVSKKEKTDKPDEFKIKVNRINYELGILLTIRMRLRCKNIWVNEAGIYRNPDDDLLKDFDRNRDEYYKSLNQPIESKDFISILKTILNDWLNKLNKNIVKNKDVKITKRKGNGWIKLTPVGTQEEPTNILQLKQAISNRWSVSLLDMLKEVELRLDLTSVFESMASKEMINRSDLQYRLLLCLFGFATNTGLKRVSNNEDISAKYNDLRYVQRRYINTDNIRHAIAKLINGSLKIRDKELFGDATISCASDSTKFSAWDQNLLTEWHVRYKGPGIMVYWHVDKKSLCVYSQLKTCSSSEIVAMLTGIIHHSTDAEIKKNYVDSHGQSLIAFAFSYLLGFDLLPRLKGIGSEKLYKAESKDEYKNITDILTRAIDWELIKDNYDQMIQYSAALMQKHTNPESLLKKFTANNLKHPVYQALQELGRVVKTIFLCRYLDSKELRVEVHDGLNVVERWNGVNDFIFYGRKGMISSNDSQNQELSILSLHLLQSSLVYMNTLMIQEVLKGPEWQNRLTVEDKRVLSPLIYAHINPYGEFKLNMSQRLEI